MHLHAMQFFARHAQTRPPIGLGAAALDVGGRDLNGTQRDLWPDAAWSALDVREGPGVQIVADAATWRGQLEDGTMLPPGHFDLVTCAEVLEHAEQWRAIVATCCWAAGPGGLVLVSCGGPGRAPHDGAWDGTPQAEQHYMNVHADDLATELAEQDVTAYGVEYLGGPVCDTYGWAVIA